MPDEPRLHPSQSRRPAPSHGRRLLHRRISVRPTVKPLVRNDSRRQVHKKCHGLDELRELSRKKASFSGALARAAALVARAGWVAVQPDRGPIPDKQRTIAEQVGRAVADAGREGLGSARPRPKISLSDDYFRGTPRDTAGRSRTAWPFPGCRASTPCSGIRR